MRSMKGVCLVFILGLAAAALGAGEAVSHPQLGFRLTVPDGFKPAPERIQGKVLYAYQREAAAGQPVGTFLLVSRLGGVLGREKITPQQIAAANPRVTVIDDKWKGFDVQVFRVPEEADGVQMLTFNAQVPLKPEAVQVTVIGEAAREAELRGVLRSALDGLDGETNWLTDKQRMDSLTDGMAQLIVTIGVVIFVVGSVVVMIWRSVTGEPPPRKRNPRRDRDDESDPPRRRDRRREREDD
jgi:hypothetical protein